MRFFQAPVALLLAFVLLLSSCASTASLPTDTPALSAENGTGQRDTGMKKSTKNGLLAAGALAGAVIGRLVGGDKGTAIGAIIGAAAGGDTGAAIGRKMDKQAAELQRDMANARVERVGEGIKITLNAGMLFDTNKSVIRPAGLTDLDKLVTVLQKYPDPNVLVEGHADNSGSDAINHPQYPRHDPCHWTAQFAVLGPAAPPLHTPDFGSSPVTGTWAATWPFAPMPTRKSPASIPYYFRDMKDTGEQLSGNVLDPNTGKVYKATLKLTGPETLKVRIKVMGLVAASETWTRQPSGK